MKPLIPSLLVLLLVVGGDVAVAQAIHKVELREVGRVVSAEAMIEATRQATVATQVSGRIVAVKVDAGDRVRAGQVLMQIDAREAGEQVAAARAQLAQAEANYIRTQNLFKQKFVSQAALDTTEAALKSARAQAAAAGAGASHATVTAPLAGIVALRHADLGDLAMPGKPLLTVFDPQGLRAVASISQYQLREAREARVARIEFPEDKSRPWRDGSRIEILPTIDPQSHTATVRVYLAEPAGLVPGMLARVHFVVGTAQKLTVPPQAILRRGEISAVYVLGANKVQLRQIRPGEPVADGEIEVLSGLAAGETVSLDPVRTGIELKQSPVR
jgi:RND family efflux transporter MFP subunit